VKTYGRGDSALAFALVFVILVAVLVTLTPDHLHLLVDRVLDYLRAHTPPPTA
jgi:hypothetical protein